MTIAARAKAQAGRTSALGRAVLLIGIVTFFHSAFSMYEYLSIRKSLGLPKQAAPLDITAETLVSFLLLVLGIVMTAAPLKNITWSSEMRTRTIDDVDVRQSFATLDHRGTVLFNNASKLLETKAV